MKKQKSVITKVLFSLLVFLFIFSCSKPQKSGIVQDVQQAANDLLEQQKQLELQEQIEQQKQLEQQKQIEQQKQLEQQKYESAIISFVDEMSPKELIAQMFLVTIGGTSFSNNYYNTQNFVSPGGYLLFAYNFTDKASDAINFTSDINNWYLQNNFVPPFFSVDQEGGFVNRLKTVASPLPSQYSVAKFLSAEQAQELYDYSAKQIASLGIHVNLAPVVEILTDENKLFLDTRSFGDINAVKNYSNIFIQAMLNSNVYPVVKHFPGNNSDDPHLGLPIIKAESLYSDESFSKTFVEPFSSIKQKDDVGILVAHTVLSGIGEPSCLNYQVVTDYLKNNLGFSGLVFSDDLLMKALTDNGFPPEKAISMAIKAGINVLMVSQKEYTHLVDDIVPMLESESNLLFEAKKSVYKIIDFKIQHGLLDYSDGVVSIPNPKSEDELNEAKMQKLEAFNNAKQNGQDFYQTYWGK